MYTMIDKYVTLLCNRSKYSRQKNNWYKLICDNTDIMITVISGFWNMIFAIVFVFVAEKSLNRCLEEKRKLYRCGSGFHTLDSILTWPQYYKSNQKDIQAFALRGVTFSFMQFR